MDFFGALWALLVGDGGGGAAAAGVVHVVAGRARGLDFVVVVVVVKRRSGGIRIRIRLEVEVRSGIGVRVNDWRRGGRRLDEFGAAGFYGRSWIRIAFSLSGERKERGRWSHSALVQVEKIAADATDFREWRYARWD
ncbi:hypothetical protein MRB53_004717 [Persea americana]|uniref:Uncharacterized protein n=1 Tax=Persea americana TaxID=3435 RepID=A0ACC2MB78_PERAE|nr:hypothetical protein MRB53_004717 [Persea americana]